MVLSKFVVLLSVIIVISLLSFLIEFIFFNVRYGLPNWNFPYQSLATFQNSFLPLTLFQATLLIFFLRLFGFCILGIITISISIASQSVISSLIGGLTLIALPYVLPVSSTSKVFLPSPYSLVIATPFLYASYDPILEKNTFAFVTQVTDQHLLGILLMWFIFAVFLLLYIRRKFGYIRYKPHRNKSSLLFYLLLIPLLFGCTSPRLSDRDPLTVNFSFDFIYTYDDPYIVSLFPTFMIEDTRNSSVAKISRNPFLNKEFIDKHVGGIFIDNNVLYYSITAIDYEQINSINLTTWETQELYTRYPQQQVSIINDDLETHIKSEGKSKLSFMIYDDKIFILDGEELVMISIGGSKEIPIIKKISQQVGLAFKDGNFYYINKINELRTYSLLDKSDQSLLGIKAMYQLFISGNQLYFLNLDRGLNLFSVNIDSNEIRQVLNAEIGNYACDDTYAYFTNQKDNGYLYRADLKSGEQILIAPISNILNIQVLPGKPYLYVRATDPFVEDSFITYKIDKTDWSSERLKYYEDFDKSLN